MSEPQTRAETITGDPDAHPRERQPSPVVLRMLDVGDFCLRLARRHTESLETRDAIDEARKWLDSARTSEEVVGDA